MAEKQLISVIMPAYNAGEFIEKAVESILTQSYPYFELLIFEDCSTDNTFEILQGIQDDRIRLFPSESNRGYLVHLNEGIEKSRGKYIARMDADDISAPNRFAEQVEFLEKNPVYGLCGCWFREFNGKKEFVKKPPVHHVDLELILLKKNPFCHSSVMLRKEVLVKQNLRYDLEYYTSEDYLLWSRLARVSCMHVIPKILHAYRYHQDNISNRKRDQQRDLSKNIQLINLDRLGQDELNEEQRDIYLKLLWGKRLIVKEFSIADEMLNTLWELNRQKKVFERKGFERYISRLGQRLLVQAIKAEKYTETKVSKFHVYKMLPLHRKMFMNFNTKI